MTADIATASGREAVSLPPDHPKVQYGRIGVLLMNLGTPEGTGYWPMRHFLVRLTRRSW